MATKAIKVVLGKRPETFKKEITFPMLDGTEGCMEVIYKYRTKSELAEFNDALQADLKAEADAEIARYEEAIEKKQPLPEFTQGEINKRQAAIHIGYIMGSVKGWNLDVPFDKDAVAELVDTLPAAVTEMVGTYRTAINEGRLGNLKP